MKYKKLAIFQIFVFESHDVSESVTFVSRILEFSKIHSIYNQIFEYQGTSN